MQDQSNKPFNSISRRDFLKMAALTGAHFGLAYSPIRLPGSVRDVYSAGFPGLPEVVASGAGLLGPNSLIQSTFGDESHPGNFEAVVLIGDRLQHYYHDNADLASDWKEGRVITEGATGPGSIMQSTSINPGFEGNFEVVVQKDERIWHYWHDNTNVDLPWTEGAVITERAIGPASIIQSRMGNPSFGNYEIVVPEPEGLRHYYYDFTNNNNYFEQGKLITPNPVQAGCLIQSTLGFSRANPGNFEVVVLEDTGLWHYYHDNSNPNLDWVQGQLISQYATGPGCIIQSNIGASENQHGNFEVVVQEGNYLVHYWHDNSDPNLPWRRGAVVSTAASGPGCIIQSTVKIKDSPGDFEVLAQECQRSVVHYKYANYTPEARDWDPNFFFPFVRWKPVLSEQDPPRLDWTRKVVQLTGEYDLQGWNGINDAKRNHTDNRTETRAGIRGTDLGASFWHNQQVFFLFGDTYRICENPVEDQKNRELDAVAYTTDGSAASGLKLTFNEQPPLLDRADLPQNEFNVPLDGFSWKDRMYVFFSTHSYQIYFPKPDPNDNYRSSQMGFSLLAVSDNDGRDFEVLGEISRRKFINISVQVADSGAAVGLPDAGPCLLMWGSGRYRASDVYFAYLPLSELHGARQLRYFAGLQRDGAPIWQTDELKAVELFCAGNVGEFSVRWNHFLGLWMMTYNSDNPRGIILRTAVSPWGDWTASQKILFRPSLKDSKNEGVGYGQFMHQVDMKPDGSCTSPDHVYDKMFSKDPDNNLCAEDLDRSCEWGGEYGPYQISHYARGLNGLYSKIYFCMSTWNPYQVMLMTGLVEAEGVTLDLNAYAYDSNALDYLKYARIAMRLAERAAEYKLILDYPIQISLCIADHIEWGQEHKPADMVMELKKRFELIMAGISDPESVADAYATAAADLVLLGGGWDGESTDYTPHFDWALEAMQSGSQRAVIDKMNQRLEKGSFINDQLNSLYLPIVEK